MNYFTVVIIRILSLYLIIDGAKSLPVIPSILSMKDSLLGNQHLYTELLNVILPLGMGIILWLNTVFFSKLIMLSTLDFP